MNKAKELQEQINENSVNYKTDTPMILKKYQDIVIFDETVYKGQITLNEATNQTA